MRLIPTLLSFAMIGAATLAGCVGLPAGTAAQSRPLPLDIERPATDRVGAFAFRGAVMLTQEGLGGLSGLVVGEGGRRFVAVTDRGEAVRGSLRHDAAGRLVAVEDVERAPLALERNRHSGRRGDDAEEIARLPDGSWLVAFERDHRILRYPPPLTGPGAEPVRLPDPPGLETAPSNGGIEAMAVLDGGRILAIEEGDDPLAERHRAWLGTPPLAGRGGWQSLSYRSAAGFRPTGATVLPTGDVLVLERRVTLLGGWAARIVRVPAAAIRAGAVLEGEELALLEPPLLVDNYEGISAIAGRDGETLVYLVSDDNFSALQRTVFLLLALPAGALPAGDTARPPS